MEAKDLGGERLLSSVAAAMFFITPPLGLIIIPKTARAHSAEKTRWSWQEMDLLALRGGEHVKLHIYRPKSSSKKTFCEA